MRDERISGGSRVEVGTAFNEWNGDGIFGHDFFGAKQMRVRVKRE
jgi:hypothetical protein